MAASAALPVVPAHQGPAFPWPESRLFPFRSRYIDIQGARMHYVDEGAGPVLLCLHPAPATSFIYREFIRKLSGRFRCIALDYPGFGLSAAPADGSVSLEALSAAVDAFVQALDLREITLFVHDSGGPVGFGAAALAPERYAAFIITDTFAFPLGQYPLMRTMLRLATSPPMRWVNRTLNLLPWLVSTLAPVRRRLSRGERLTYRRLFPTAEARDRILLLMRDLVRGEDRLAWIERNIKMHLANRPALLMYGQFDPTRFAGWMSRFQGLFPEHQAQVIPWEGHFPHEGSPDTMIAAIETWSATLTRQGSLSRDTQTDAGGEKAD